MQMKHDTTSSHPLINRNLSDVVVENCLFGYMGMIGIYSVCKLNFGLCTRGGAGLEVGWLGRFVCIGGSRCMWVVSLCIVNME